MVIKDIITPALFYGAVTNGYLFLMMITFSPRVWGYKDYPDIVKKKVPAQTKKERTLAVFIAVPWFVFVLGFPVLSTLALKAKLGGEIPFTTASLNVLIQYATATVGDLVLLDWLIVSMWTPKFVIIPGSAKEDYKDFSHHFKSHAKAVIPMIIFGLIVAGLVCRI